MSKGGQQSSPSTVTQVTSNQLPAWALPVAQGLLSRASNLTNQPYSPYPYIYRNPNQKTQATTNPGSTIFDNLSGGNTGAGNESSYYDFSTIPWTVRPQTTSGTAGTTGSTGIATTPGAGYYNIYSNEYIPEGQNVPFTSRIAPQAAETLAGLNAITNRAIAGSPVTASASQNLYNTLRGDYLNPESNPFLSSTYNQAARDITRNYLQSIVPQLSAAANRAGAFGGSSDVLMRGEAMRGLGESLSRTATDLYSQNYANERANQLKAMMFAPTMAAQDYEDFNKLLGVGDVRNQYQQALLDELYGNWQQQSQYPYTQLDKLGQYLNAAIGNSGTSSSTSSQTLPQASLASRIMGGATSGAGLGLAAAGMGMNPFGAAALGLIPLIGSLF